MRTSLCLMMSPKCRVRYWGLFLCCPRIWRWSRFSISTRIPFIFSAILEFLDKPLLCDQAGYIHFQIYFQRNVVDQPIQLGLEQANLQLEQKNGRDECIVTSKFFLEEKSGRARCLLGFGDRDHGVKLPQTRPYDPRKGWCFEASASGA